MGERITFDGPNGPEVHEWNGRLGVQEAIALQNVSGMVPIAFFNALAELDPTAWAAMVQLLWKREGKVVKFSDVDFDLMSCRLEDDDADGDDGEGDTPAVEGDDSPN